MAKRWVLDTETKGTGAHVVPLDKALHGSDRKPELNLVELQRPAPPSPARDADTPKRRLFKIIDVMTHRTLAEGIDLRATVDLLGDVRTIVDVHIYAWDADRRRWRMLRLDEQRALWDARRERRLDSAAAGERDVDARLREPGDRTRRLGRRRRTAQSGPRGSRTGPV